MNAIISGQAGSAVCIDGNRFFSVSVDAPDILIDRQRWELPYLIPNTQNLIWLKNTTTNQVVENLKTAWEQDRALHMCLILLNIDVDQDIREQAAECLEDFFQIPAVKDFVGNHLYASPLPEDADTRGALDICSRTFRNDATTFLNNLSQRQSKIIQLFDIWNALPEATFGGLSEKVAFRAKAIKHGVFRRFASEATTSGKLQYEYLSHPAFRGEASKTRVVFPALAASLIDNSTQKSYEENETDFKEVAGETQKRWVRGKRGTYTRPTGMRHSIPEIFKRVERERAAIKDHLSHGRNDAAFKFIDQMVQKQRRDSKPEHVAKSLCDLAQFAKDELGSPELQRQLALRATEEAPKDAFSFATLGDAYRGLADFQRAQDSYHTARLLGDERVALIGRGEIFRDLGQLDQAFLAFNECLQKFPQDVVCLNAKAATLADCGQLQNALEAYDYILRNVASDPVTRTGHAQVLKDMGRLEEALVELIALVEDYPDQVVVQYTHAEVLREMGHLEEALQFFSKMAKKFPSEIRFRIGFIRLLRDIGKIPEAIDAYKILKKSHPTNPAPSLGLADTYRKAGDLPKALSEYNFLLENFHYNISARNGKASVLVAQGQYNDALNFLPTDLPATQGEWIAYHIRGIAYLRSGRLELAEKVFLHGIETSPWGAQNQYFKTALATLRIAQQRFNEALTLTRGLSYPTIAPITYVLSMHAFGELGNKQGFSQSLQVIKESSAPIVLDLRNIFLAQYGEERRRFTRFDVALKECDALLLAV